jgi:hypothetical protein
MIIEGGLFILVVASIAWLVVCCLPLDHSSVSDEEFYEIKSDDKTKTVDDTESAPSDSSTAPSIKKERIKKSFLWKIAKWYNSEYWFPWYALLIIYPLAFVYIAFSSFLLVLYGIKFDTDGHKSSNWLKGSGSAIATDIFVKGPIEFIVKAIIIVALIKFFEGLFFTRRKRIEEENKESQAAEKQRHQFELYETNKYHSPRSTLSDTSPRLSPRDTADYVEKVQPMND